MNKEESLDRYKEGVKAWNKWAKEMLAGKATLEENNQWQMHGGVGLNQETKDWIDESSVAFSNHAFEDAVDFSNFIFPHVTHFSNTKFSSDALFSNTTFSGDASFYDTTFNIRTWFDNTIFNGNTWFSNVTFSGEVEFGKAIFNGEAWFIKKTTFSNDACFDNTVFNGDTLFSNVTFSGDSRFGKAIFSGDTLFTEKTTFSGKAGFDNAKFSGITGFYNTTFIGEAEFKNITFSGDAKFYKTTFSDVARFNRTLFEGFTSFRETSFEKSSSFIAIKGQSFFSFKDAKFHLVPDFNQAHFIEAPQFDNSDFSQALKHNQSKSKGNLSSRWRSLKRLAIQGHDHERELIFFSEEIKSQRGIQDKALPNLLNCFKKKPVWQGGARYWFGFFYQYLSDFGRSIMRPLLLWLLFGAIFCFLYLKYPIENMSTLTHDDSIAQCDRLESAIYLSARSALPFLPVTTYSENINRSYACLYGKNCDEEANIPIVVVFLSIAQTILSTILIFLLLLALRNHFKIK